MFVCHSGKKYLLRTAVAYVALLQFGSTAALTHADALLDGERMGTPDRFESPENTDCPFQHDHLFCQVVRSLSHATASPEITAETGPAPPILYVEADCEAGEVKRAPILFGAFSPRGPPVA